MNKEYGRNRILMCLSRMEKKFPILLALVFPSLLYLLLDAYEATEKVSALGILFFVADVFHSRMLVELLRFDIYLDRNLCRSLCVSSRPNSARTRYSVNTNSLPNI